MLKKFSFYVLLIIFVVVFSIGLLFSAEIAWRTMVPVLRASLVNDAKMFPYKHYMVTTHPPNSTFYGMKFNSEGFRSPEFLNLPQKEKDEIRIVITGGSASISMGVSEDNTLDQNLKRLIQAKYPTKKIQIFNLGSGAWKSFQELIALQYYGFEIKPDIVIAFDGYNDISHATTIPIKRPYSNLAMHAFRHYVRWLETGPKQLFDNLKIIFAIRYMPYYFGGKLDEKERNSSLPKLAKRPMVRQMNTKPEFPLNPKIISTRTDFDPYLQNTIDNYLNNILLLATTSKALGAKFVSVLQPTVFLKSPVELETQKSYQHIANFVIQGYVRAQFELNQYAQKNSFLFINAVTALDGHSTRFFGDDVHFSAEGYQIVTNFIFERLQPLLEAHFQETKT